MNTNEVLDNETVTVEMYNHWRDTPKTGDDSNRMAMPVLIALAIMWLGVGCYVIKRKLFA